MKGFRRLRKRLTRLFNSGTGKDRADLGGDVGRSEMLKRLPGLTHPPSHSAILALLADTVGLTEAEQFQYVNELLLLRQFTALEDILESADVNEPLQTYLAVKIADYRGKRFLQAPGLWTYFVAYRDHNLLGRRVIHLAIEQAIRLSDAPLLLRVLAEISTKELRRLPRSAVSGLARTLSQTGHLATATRVLDDFLQEAPKEAQLYFLETKLKLGIVPVLPWRRVAEMMIDASSKDDDAKREFASVVLYSMNRIPSGERDLMDIRFFPEQRDRLTAIITNALVNAHPFALVRLGDGEAYAYPGPYGADITEDNVLRERHWWSMSLPDSLAKQIRFEVRNAVAQADVIGFPSIYRIVRDQGLTGSRFAVGKAQRAIMGLLLALGDAIPLDTAIFTEERCHYIAFTRENLEMWASRARRVVNIACWSGSELDISFGPRTEWIFIPPQTKLSEAIRDTGSKPLPFIYDEILTRLSTVGPGDLVLVAAGIIGKVFIAEARRRGAVALDVGSVFDYRAGYQTRNIIDAD